MQAESELEKDRARLEYMFLMPAHVNSARLSASIDLSGAQDVISFDGVTYAMAEVEAILRAHEERKARGL